MKTSIVDHRFSKSGMGIVLGALTVAATLIFPPISATAHEWEDTRKGPPYGWAKGHDKWKDKRKHHEHEWEHRRTRYSARRAAERRHRDYHRGDHRPYYSRQSPPTIDRHRYDRRHREHDLNRRRARHEVRLKQDQLGRDIEELKRDRRELSHDIRNGASGAEIRRHRQEIRQDRQNIAATGQELRRDRARLEAAGRDRRPNSGW